MNNKEQEGLLKTIFLDGKQYNKTDLKTIRAKIDASLV